MFEQILAVHPFFEGLKPEHMHKLVECASAVHYDAGTLIFREGGPADTFWAIHQGDVALEVMGPGGEPRVLQTVHAGEVLGWSWLFAPYTWSFDAHALTQVRAIAFDAPTLREQKRSDCEFGYELMNRFARVIAIRLQATRLQLLDLYGNRR